VIVDVVRPLLAVVFATIGAVALTYAVEVRSRRQTRVAFERFVPPQVGRRAAAPGRHRAAPGEPPAGGHRAVLRPARLHVPGRSGLTAEQVHRRAQTATWRRCRARCSTRAAPVVSYQGDGVMAVFGAPLPQADHAGHALAAARENRRRGPAPFFNAWPGRGGTGRSARSRSASASHRAGHVGQRWLLPPHRVRRGRRRHQRRGAAAGACPATSRAASSCRAPRATRSAPRGGPGPPRRRRAEGPPRAGDGLRRLG